MEGEALGENPTSMTGTPTSRGCTFFSSSSFGQFFDELRLLLNEQYAQTLHTQEALIVQVIAPIIALTVMIERLIGPAASPPHGVPPAATQLS